MHIYGAGYAREPEKLAAINVSYLRELVTTDLPLLTRRVLAGSCADWQGDAINVSNPKEPSINVGAGAWLLAIGVKFDHDGVAIFVRELFRKYHNING